MFLLDTNIVSELVKRAPNPNLLQRFAVEHPELLCISAITVFELRYGAARSPRPAALWRRIQVEIIGRFKVLPLDQEDSLMAADLLAPLEAAGFQASNEDILLAGTAVRRGFTLVTRNRRDFDRIVGLRIENWFEQI